MTVSGSLSVSATIGFYHFKNPFKSFSPSPVIRFKAFNTGRVTCPEVITKLSSIKLEGDNTRCHCSRSFGITRDSDVSQESVSQESDSLLYSAIRMNFFERLSLAWNILFPSPSVRKNSNAKIAKQRLKMILFSDRCAVSDEAKQKIVSSIVGVLSDFVDIDSEDKVQLSVSTDPDLGTVYSVVVPVRRVKPDYQEEYDSGTIMDVDYRDTGESSGSVDVKFNFFVPEKFQQ